MFDFANFDYNSGAFGFFLNNEHNIDWNMYPRRIRSYTKSKPLSFAENSEKNKWHWVCINPCAITLIEKNMKYADWGQLTQNPAAIHLLRRFYRFVDYDLITFNPAAIEFIIENHDRITAKGWTRLSCNPSISHLIKDDIIHLTDDLKIPVDWFWICGNSSAMDIIESNQDKISNWAMASSNPAAVSFLERNPKLIRFNYLCGNPAAMHLITKKISDIDWDYLSENPSAVDLLKNNPGKINWSRFCAYNRLNPFNEPHLVEEFDRSELSNRDVASIQKKRYTTIRRFEENQNTLFKACKVKNTWAMMKILKNKKDPYYKTAETILGNVDLYGEKLRQRNYFAHDAERIHWNIHDIHSDSTKYQILQHFEFVRLEIARIYQIILTEDSNARKLKMPRHHDVLNMIRNDPIKIQHLLGRNPTQAYSDMIDMRNRIAHPAKTKPLTMLDTKWFNNTFVR